MTQDSINRFLQNQFKGTVRPIVKRRSAPPVHIEFLNVGTSGRFFTTIKCWVHKPTKEYPDYGIFLSFNNGNSSTFSKISDVTELEAISNFFQSQISKIKAIIPSLEAESKIYHDADNAYQQQLENLRLLQQAMNPQPAQDTDFIEDTNE